MIFFGFPASSQQWLYMMTAQEGNKHIIVEILYWIIIVSFTFWNVYSANKERSQGSSSNINKAFVQNLLVFINVLKMFAHIFSFLLIFLNIYLIKFYKNY